MPALKLPLGPLNHLLLSYSLAEKKRKVEEGGNKDKRMKDGNGSVFGRGFLKVVPR